MKKLPEFRFTKEQLEDMKAALQTYCAEELDVELGNLPAEMFVDFLNEHIGRHYYNLGVTDSLAVMRDRVEELVMLVKE